MAIVLNHKEKKMARSVYKNIKNKLTSRIIMEEDERIQIEYLISGRTYWYSRQKFNKKFKKIK